MAEGKAVMICYRIRTGYSPIGFESKYIAFGPISSGTRRPTPSARLERINVVMEREKNQETRYNTTQENPALLHCLSRRVIPANCASGI